MLAALERRSIIMRWFMWIETKTFAGLDAPIGFWTGSGTVTVQGRDYIGSGSAITVGELAATSDSSIPSLEVTVSGVDEEALRAMRGYRIDQAPITVYIGLFDAGSDDQPGTRQLIDLFRHFKGFINKAPIPTPKPGDVSQITFTCSSVSRSLSGKSGLVRSDAAQQQLYPGDTFRKWQGSLRGKQVAFGTGDT